jgi:glycosyltransferase involved in cell wall biosynthesis
MKPKLLCILHRSPPMHGAAKVGDFIAGSQKLIDNYDCRFITINSSGSIGEIGKVSLKKLYLFVELYMKVLWALLMFRPNKIYFTASIRSVAFYRDLLISTLWKTYRIFKPLDIFYHYHTKGINDFVSISNRNLKLTRFFLNKVNLILLTPLLESDFTKVQTYKHLFYLPNGVSNPFTETEFKRYIDTKYIQDGALSVLYLSNMIKSKGYFRVLELANYFKQNLMHFHFAGAWERKEDETEFFDYISQNGLDKSITFHGFVNGIEKDALLKAADFLVFPTRYKAESFGLVITEAMSYGVPVIASDEGSIPYILDEKSGIVLNDIEVLPEALEEAKTKLFNKRTALYCRKRYLDNFSSERFELKLLEILSKS